MRKTLDTDLLMAGRKYAITPARLGDSSFQRRLDTKTLLFPPTFTQSVLPANYPLERKLAYKEEQVDAQALICLAEGFLNTWPSNSKVCKSFMGTWKGDPFLIPFETAKGAIQEYALSVNTLSKVLGSSRDDDYKLFRYWFGIRHRDADGQITYYPTLSETKVSGIAGFERVILEDGSKEGTIISMLDYEGSPITQAKSVIYYVQVDWDDGSSSQEPYSGVRHVTPQGVGSSRVQEILGAYKGGVSNIEVKDYNDLVEKVAVMMVYVAFTRRFHSVADMNDAVNAVCSMTASTQQEANLSFAYKKYTEIDTTTGTVTAYGWGADSGMREIRQMWAYVSSSSTMLRVADWATWPAKFVDKVQTYGVGVTKDTGLVVCPHCKLCERITDANFVDYGVYFGGDSNPFKSVTYQTKEVNGNKMFKALGIVKCNSCSKLYYRKFKPIMRREKEQMPIGISELSQIKPYSTQWIIRSVGLGAKMGRVEGYSFLEKQGGVLPMIRFYLTYGGRVMGVDYPLEVGAMGRIGQRDTLCTGASQVPSSGMTSHKYYDWNYAPPFIDPASGETMDTKGKGKYVGNNTTDFANADPLTRSKLCDWCEKVGVPTTLSESNSYAGGARSWMIIDRGDGSSTFDRLGEDYTESNTGKVVYKLRLISPSGDRIRFLEVKAEDVGVALEDAPPLVAPTVKGRICPNDKWVEEMFSAFDDYAQDLQNATGAVTKSLGCDGLAWSARYDGRKLEWVVSKPPSDWLLNNSIVNPDGIAGQIDAVSWADGENRLLYDGEERFPAKECGVISYVSPYSSCMNVQGISSSHKVETINQEKETEITESGSSTTKLVTHLWCKTCNESFVGAPDDGTAQTFVIPESTDPMNTPERTEKQGDNSLFNEKNEWHFTHLLYPPENKSLEDIVNSATFRDSIKQKMPNSLFSWFSNGKRLNRTPSTGDDEDD